MFGDCPLVELYFLQEGLLFIDSVEIKEKLGVGVVVP